MGGDARLRTVEGYAPRVIDREGAHRLAEEYLQEHGWSSHVVSHVQTLS